MNMVTQNMVLRPVKKQTLTEIVAERLVWFVRNKLRPGEKLPSERELMKQLHVGRSSLREAMRSLDIMGLVEVRTGNGTFVTSEQNRFYRKPLEWGVFNNERSIKDLLEARAVFEIAFVELASIRITDDELAEMEIAVERMEQTSPPNLKLFLDSDLHFHELLVGATKNDVLYEAMNLTFRILKAQEAMCIISTKEEYRKSSSLHRNIFEALKKGDRVAARKAMEAHFEWTKLIFEK
jgi:GntR family transcriptional repressor for pyruvate dehydrogenase complex